MTEDLEWDMRDTARDLAGLYRELDEAKHQPLQPRGERVMRPRPGPKAPGNWLAISRDAELVDHLVEMVCDARNYVQPGYCVGRDGRVLCNWIAFNAAAIAELDFAPDLHDLMRDQARKIDRWLHPAGIDQVANRPEPRQVSEVICQRLARMGHRAARDLLRQWASRGHISSVIRSDGRATYLLSEVVEHATRSDLK